MQDPAKVVCYLTAGIDITQPRTTSQFGLRRNCLVQDFGGSGTSRRGSTGGNPRGPQVVPKQTTSAARQLLHQHHHHDPHSYQERGVIEFSKDESESDNAALSDQNSDGILPITQIVAQHNIKQVGNDS